MNQHEGHPDPLTTQLMVVVGNQLVVSVNTPHPVVVIINHLWNFDHPCKILTQIQLRLTSFPPSFGSMVRNGNFDPSATPNCEWQLLDEFPSTWAMRWLAGILESYSI